MLNLSPGNQDFVPFLSPASVLLGNYLPLLRQCSRTTITNDLDVEGDEQFIIFISATNIQGNVFLTAQNTTTVIITDNDQGAAI